MFQYKIYNPMLIAKTIKRPLRSSLGVAATLPLFVLFAMTVRAVPSAAATGAEDRACWLAILEKIAGPVLDAGAAGELKKRMPIEAHPKTGAENRALVTHLECVGRTLTGIAPWLELELPDARSAEARLQAKFRRQAVTLLASAVDPKSPDYCTFTKGQSLVDAAFLAQALLRAPKQLWEPLSPQARVNLKDALKATRAIKAPQTNWLLFPATVEAALARFGEPGEWRREPVELALTKHKEWYMGDGSYGDGPEFHWDYYNSYVIQPMLLDVLSVFAGEPWVDEKFAENAPARARRFAAVQERMISPEGAIPVMGRSLVYRVGALQVLGQVTLRRDLPKELSPAQVRCGMTAALRRMMEAPGSFDANGWLRIGFCGAQPSLGETYISTGSLYLCAAGLLPLGLSPSDPFWRDAPADWTSKKVYAGEDMSGDHALYGKN